MQRLQFRWEALLMVFTLAAWQAQYLTTCKCRFCIQKQRNLCMHGLDRKTFPSTLTLRFSSRYNSRIEVHNTVMAFLES